MQIVSFFIKKTIKDLTYLQNFDTILNVNQFD